MEELETLCYDLAALPLALFTEDGLMRTVQKLRVPGISVKMEVILDSIEPSLNVFWGGMLLNYLNSGDTFASFAEQVVKHLTNNARNAVKRPKIQTTKEMRLQKPQKLSAPIQPTNKGLWTLLLIQLTTPL